MTEIRFYHLENQRIEQALPALLTKALEAGHRILIKSEDPNQIKSLNDHLWTHNAATFLPHGTEKEGFTADHPIYLTTKDENPNQSTMLLLLNAAALPPLDEYKLCCNLFDAHAGNALEKAREQWKTLKEEGKAMTYWQQTEGRWIKKADTSETKD